MSLPVSIIAALADNSVIGNDNHLIWRLKSDMRRFRSLTMGTPMIMGRKTFESIGRPLPGRATLVLTRDRSFSAEGVVILHDLDEALARAQEIGLEMNAPAVTIAGGADIYAQAMQVADELRLTLVHASPEGDALFPAIDHVKFVENSRKSFSSGPDDEFAYTFLDYRRRLSPIDR